MRSLVVTALAIVLSSNLSAEEHPMQKLDWLLGEWTFEDRQVNGPYREQGTRKCMLTLSDQYIRCESAGTSMSGHERTYHFIIGYNSIDARYEMLGLTSSYPRQNLYIIELSADGHTLELTNHFWTNEGLVEINEATIQFNGTNQYVWQIRNGELDAETGLRSVGFIDTVTRISIAP